MADTATKVRHNLERPKTTAREKLMDFHLDRGAPIPSPEDVDMSTFDILDPELWRRDAHWDFFTWMRDNDPLHYTPDSFSGPFWSVTLYEDIQKVDIDHKRFSSSWEYGGITILERIDDIPEEQRLELPMFIAMDRPKHTGQRKTVAPAFTPTEMKRLEDEIRERTGETLDALPRGETFDWVETVSIPLTTGMLAILFDFPWEDRDLLTHWSDWAGDTELASVRALDDVRRGMLHEMAAYFQMLWAERAERGEAPDLISRMIHSPAMNQMEPQEFMGNLVLLIVGGNDTTRNSISGGVYFLNKFPDQYAKLKADPSLIPNMVSEIIRYQTPLAHMRRVATEDTELGGQKIRKGDKVVMWYVSGNRDEEAIERPDEFLIDRQNARRHVSFGFGIHRCMGNRVAEMQLRILWEEIMNRFEHVEVVGEPERVLSNFVLGYTHLPVVLHAKAN